MRKLLNYLIYIIDHIKEAKEYDPSIENMYFLSVFINLYGIFVVIYVYQQIIRELANLDICIRFYNNIFTILLTTFIIIIPSFTFMILFSTSVVWHIRKRSRVWVDVKNKILDDFV